MKHYYPDYAEKFRCIAAACPDSCCQGWDVVIDEEAEAVYNAVRGEFGEALRSSVITDSDGDRVFRLTGEKKCPFWGADRLCEIYRELGEDYLCRTCALFPRIIMDYTSFAEHTLALACPEAARLIVSSENAYASFADEECEPCGAYDADTMSFLLKSRMRAAQILTKEKPLAQRLEALGEFAREKQRELTGFAEALNYHSISELYKELDYIGESSRERIVRAAERAPELKRERELSALALYWLYRYWLTAIDSLDLLSPVRFLTVSAGIVSNLAEDGDVAKAAQLYSKEVEQSYENMELLGICS